MQLRKTINLIFILLIAYESLIPFQVSAIECEVPVDCDTGDLVPGFFRAGYQHIEYIAGTYGGGTFDQSSWFNRRDNGIDGIATSECGCGNQPDNVGDHIWLWTLWVKVGQKLVIDPEFIPKSTRYNPAPDQYEPDVDDFEGTFLIFRCQFNNDSDVTADSAAEVVRADPYFYNHNGTNEDFPSTPVNETEIATGYEGNVTLVNRGNYQYPDDPSAGETWFRDLKINYEEDNMEAGAYGFMIAVSEVNLIDEGEIYDHDAKKFTQEAQGMTLIILKVYVNDDIDPDLIRNLIFWGSVGGIIGIFAGIHYFNKYMDKKRKLAAMGRFKEDETAALIDFGDGRVQCCRAKVKNYNATNVQDRVEMPVLTIERLTGSPRYTCADLVLDKFCIPEVDTPQTDISNDGTNVQLDGSNEMDSE